MSRRRILEIETYVRVCDDDGRCVGSRVIRGSVAVDSSNKNGVEQITNSTLHEFADDAALYAQKLLLRRDVAL